MENFKVPRRIANGIINSLKGGVVPRAGLGYIAVGREKEIGALLKDLELIEDGQSTFRFISGVYGSGKTFLLQTIKERAVNTNFVVADADLSPNRLMIGTNQNKKGLATFKELMGNISTKTAPDGNGLEGLLDVWMDSIWIETAKNLNGVHINGLEIVQKVEDRILDIFQSVESSVSGYDMAKVLVIYWRAKQIGNKDLKSKTLRWLRGEYRLKSDAQKDLGISGIIDDNDWFTYIKIYSKLFKAMGYKGFIVMIDEVINIYKCFSDKSREKNYEIILNMYNDALQGRVPNLGIIMGGTPLSIEDTKRGVFSYEALESRLKSGKYDDKNIVNLMAPILRIQSLTKSEIVILLEKLTEIHSQVYNFEHKISEIDLLDYVDFVYLEDDVTPRSIIRDYIDVLNILYQNEKESIRTIMYTYRYSKDREADDRDSFV